MIDWSEVHIDWSGVDVVASITHIPTNTTININSKLDPDDNDGRQALLQQLDAAVQTRV